MRIEVDSEAWRRAQQIARQLAVGPGEYVGQVVRDHLATPLDDGAIARLSQTRRRQTTRERIYLRIDVSSSDWADLVARARDRRTTLLRYLGARRGGPGVSRSRRRSLSENARVSTRHVIQFTITAYLTPTTRPMTIRSGWQTPLPARSRTCTASSASTARSSRSARSSSGKVCERFAHSFGRVRRILVLPHADGVPAQVREHRLRLSIALNVPRQLGLPIRRVRSRHVRVLGAAVPEAAIDEDGDASTGEGDIHADGATAGHLDWIVAAESESDAMKRRAKGDLGSRVPLPISLHHGGHCSRAGVGVAVCLTVRARRRSGDETGCR